jgi:hypothetical protein
MIATETETGALCVADGRVTGESGDDFAARILAALFPAGRGPTLEASILALRD